MMMMVGTKKMIEDIRYGVDLDGRDPANQIF